MMVMKTVIQYRGRNDANSCLTQCIIPTTARDIHGTLFKIYLITIHPS